MLIVCKHGNICIAGLNCRAGYATGYILHVCCKVQKFILTFSNRFVNEAFDFGPLIKVANHKPA